MSSPQGRFQALQEARAGRPPAEASPGSRTRRRGRGGGTSRSHGLVRTSVSFLLVALCTASSIASTPGPQPGSPTFELAWVWTTPGISIGTAGLAVEDVDGDGSAEVFALAYYNGYGTYANGRWLQLSLDGTLQEDWSSLEHPDDIFRMALVRDAAGLHVVIVTADAAFVHSAPTKALERQFAMPSATTFAVAFADLEGDSSLEMLTCDQKSLHIQSFATGQVLASRFGFGCSDLEVAQVDEDPQLEIVLAGNGLGGFVLDGSSLEVQWARLQGFGQLVELADADHDGEFEIVFAEQGEYTLHAVDPSDGTTVWVRPQVDVASLEAVDLDGDSDLELLAAGFVEGGIFALDESTGDFLWNDQMGSIGALAAGDLDGDGTLELLWSAVDDYHLSPSKLVVADAATREIETSTERLPGPFHDLGFGDLDADGRLDVVTAAGRYGTSSGPGRLVRFDEASRRLEYVGPPVDPSGYSMSVERSLLAQLDADEPLEACLLIVADFPASKLTCEDGVTHLEEWSVEFEEDELPTSLAQANIDADPFPEILVGTTRPAVYAFEGESGWLKWRTPSLPYNALFDTLEAGDVLGGPELEIVASGGNCCTTMLLVLEPLAGSPIGVPHMSTATFDLAQLDVDAPMEILVASTDGVIADYDAQSGTLGPPIATYSTPIASVRAADVTRDGSVDLVVVTDERVLVRGGAESATIWTSPYLGPAAGQTGSLVVENADSDGLPEIVVSLGYGFAIIEIPLYEVFVDGFGSGDTSAWSSTHP